MIFNLANPYELDKYKEYVNTLFKKKAVVEVKEKKKNRTLPQNKYLHVLLSYYASFSGESTEDVKYKYYKRECNKDIYIQRKVNKFGKEVERTRSSSELDTGEMSLSIDNDTVQILAVVGGWGYTEKGWISMMYVELPERVYVTGSATVTVGLNIREAPDPSAEKVDAYREGDRVTIMEVKDGWGKTDKGWINLDYVKYD